MWPEIAWRLKRATYNHLCEAIFSTRPICSSDDGVIIFSMIGTGVMIPYMVAAKSLHHHLRRGRFVILDDGTLTGRDRSLLRRHLDDPVILSIKDVDVGPCPRGGTWERLLTILDMAAGNYIIQLDSDTVTTGPIPHVEAAIAANASFTLLGAETRVDSILDAGEFERRFFPGGSPSEEDRTGHIQGATESLLTRLEIPGLERPRYVRGCSGFTGFARGQNRALATAFSQAMSAMLGQARWREWGTEQVTSNFVVANDANAVALPSGLYVNYWGEPIAEDVRFLHFIGTYRWHKFTYLQRSLAAIRSLDRTGRRPLPTGQAAGDISPI
ncbi:hypothetical protein BV96_00987 [Sphingomonas paucimobilis]|nr:hypothetical protein BV96_00987 [Sphingomonas paucimobilis]